MSFKRKVFTVPDNSEEIKQNITITTKTSKLSKEEIIKQAFKFHLQGNIKEAARCYEYFIKNGFIDHRVFTNYGNIFRDLDKLTEAEQLYRKAIEINPNYANAYSNLGTVLKDHGKLKEAELLQRKAIEIKPDLSEPHFNLGIILKNIGKLKEAELSLEKAIEINPEFAKAYFALSSLNNNNKNNHIWKVNLFSKSILNQKSKQDKINIYFARSNVLHNEKNYKKSAEFLKLANDIKLSLTIYKPDTLISKSNTLLLESNNEYTYHEEIDNYPESIFIVGMPRSGSTLIESILSMNNSVYDLGEINAFEESFLEYKRNGKSIPLSKLYFEKVNYQNTNFHITTNKLLNNYQYVGIIIKHIPKVKIIHSFRNPLDNILSIYRAHFTRGNKYSSSLVDCAKVYLDQEEVMAKYKKRFRSEIFDLNYDLLVSNPNLKIKSLINWLGWEWEDKYLSPHLNSRSVSTASSVQVRSPIHSKSIDGWKNYKDMLKPAVEILTQSDGYREITS